MVVDFIVERLAQRDGVVTLLAIGFCRLLTVVPELNAIKLCDVCNYVVQAGKVVQAEPSFSDLHNII